MDTRIMNTKAKKHYAVITGASSGIGKEFAKKLSEEGYRLVLVARRRERLEELAASLKTECKILTADLSRLEDCKELCKELEELSVGVFINNAGFGDCSYFLEGDETKEMEMIDVNVKAVHFLTKRILQKMTAQGGGYLLNVASSAGLMPAGPYMATYYATKSYVASLTRAIAQELKEKKNPVYIGALCPGPVDTEFNQVANASFALPGISPKDCVDYALKEMKKKKVIIVPSLAIKGAAAGAKIFPTDLVVKLASYQQKKKRQDL